METTSSEVPLPPNDLETSVNKDLIQRALDSGLSFLAAYTTRGAAVLREKGDRRDERVADKEGIYNTSFIAFGNNDLEQNTVGIYEVAVLTPCTKDVKATRTVVDKSGILGIGRKTHQEQYTAQTVPLTVTDATGGLRNGEENSVALFYFATDSGKDRLKNRFEKRDMPAFRDAFSRPGNSLHAKIILPESIGTEVSEEIAKNPKFIRLLVDAFVRSKYDAYFIEESWNKYAKPPYEVWDARPAEQRKFYFADLVRHPQNKELPMAQVVQKAIPY